MKDFRINLQLFSNHLNVTTDTRTAGQTYPAYNDLSAEMKTFYDMTLIDMAGPQLVHDQFGQKRPIPAGGGKTIEFRKFSSLPKATTALTEGVVPDGQRLDVTTVLSTVNQYGDYITQSDVLELTALDNTILEATKLLGKQAGLTLDTVVRNVLQSGTGVSYAQKINGTTETAVTSRGDLDKTALLTVDVVLQAAAKLRANNAPTINGDYVAIIHPYVAYDLMRDSEWIDWHKYAEPTNLYEGEIGKIGGVRFVQSTEAKIYGPENGLTTTSAYSAATTTVAFTGKLEGKDVAADDLIGKYIRINGVSAKITDNTTSAITIASTSFGSVASGAAIEICPCADGAVFGCLFFADGAYGVTEITGGGLETIVKQKGSAGTADPLNQKSSVGWKAMKTAEILVQEYMLRVECCSKRYSATATSN